MAVQIQLRNDTAANWTSSNPTLAQGEMGVETDTLKVKFGNGSTAWNSLAYFVNGAELDDLIGVTITSAVSGNILRYNGTTWINSSVLDGGSA